VAATTPFDCHFFFAHLREYDSTRSFTCHCQSITVGVGVVWIENGGRMAWISIADCSRSFIFSANQHFSLKKIQAFLFKEFFFFWQRLLML
jgi:hypothetical protein